MQVSQPSFQSCTKDGTVVSSGASPYTYSATEAGTVYFICSKYSHCSNRGMRIAIEVTSIASPSPTASPTANPTASPTANPTISSPPLTPSPISATTCDAPCCTPYICSSTEGERTDPEDATRSASSTLRNAAVGTKTHRGMLDSPEGWLAGRRSIGDWYQMLMGATCSPTCVASSKTIYGTVTRGCANRDNWVTRYSVDYSRDGSTWNAVDHGTQFTANSDRSTHVTISFTESVVASYIRITVRAYSKYPGMRAGVVQCDGPDVDPPVPCNSRGMDDPQDAARSASSTKGNSAAGVRNHRGRLDSPIGWLAGTRKISDGIWYQMLMGAICNPTCVASSREIFGIVTRGRANRDNWVTLYSVARAQSDSNIWSAVDNGNVFTANTDRSTYVTQLFRVSVVANYIRITVRAYSKYPAMRAGIVQCDDTP